MYAPESVLLTLLPFIFFFSLLIGSFAYLLLRIFDSRPTIKKLTANRSALALATGSIVVITAFCLALACIIVFEAFGIRWN